MAPLSAQVTGQKRKVGHDSKKGSSGARKRQKAQDARAIPTQPGKGALSASGELNVAAFVKAREFEINALDKSMQKSKEALRLRAHQEVPRNMRRRTASHNVKKVPKRLRVRAMREMKEDNTPTVTARRRTPSRKLRIRLQTAKMIQSWSKKAKTIRQKKQEAKNNKRETDPEKHVSVSRIPKIKKNTIANPPTATSKFKRRQVRKAWLPTHLWHAKRAHMTKPSEPLWRMAIPLGPTEKSYRPSHRASSARGCIAWDMSYMATIACRGTAAALESMLKGLGFHGEGWAGSKYSKWRRGIRVAEGWLSERDNDKRAISVASIFWCIEPKRPSTSSLAAGVSTDPGASGDPETSGAASGDEPSKQRLTSQLMIRVHPSAFHQLWIEVIKVAKMQRPQVLLEDLRFEIGSIELTGPESTQALVGVLKPVMVPANGASVEQTWMKLAGLTNPASLPQGCLFGFNVIDPRLHHPPMQVKPLANSDAAGDLTELLLSWPPDQTEVKADIFSHKQRYLATRALQSQKAINRRKGEAAVGQLPATKDQDPQIPVMMLATRRQRLNAQGSWTVLLPRKCVDPVWRSLLYYPLTTGGVPRFGGLNEKRQIAFELGEAWFPGDVPGTEAGKAWERTETEKRFDEWVRRPSKHRVAWETLDLGAGQKGEHGNGWACDWEYLFKDTISRTKAPAENSAAAAKTNNRPASSHEGPTPKNFTQKRRKATKAKEQEAAELAARRRNTSSPESDAEDTSIWTESDLKPPAIYTQLTPLNAAATLKTFLSTRLPEHPVIFTVCITLLERGTPASCARIYRLPSVSDSSANFRSQWLELSPSLSNSPSSKQNPNQPPPVRLKKHKFNHRNLPRSQHSLPVESLNHINYLPPDAPPDVVARFGPKRPSSEPTAEQREAQTRSLTYPTSVAEEQDKHTPCPRKEDLIGFVTTGAFNLSEGRGTAVGGLWMQRVVEGWRLEEGAQGFTGRDAKRKDREKRFCVVRNAGETVGRLGIWEVCR